MQYTFLDVGGYIVAERHQELIGLLLSLGFIHEPRSNPISEEFIISSRQDHHLIYGIQVFVIKQYPEPAFDVNISSCDILTEFAFGIFCKLRDFIVANQWKPSITDWRVYVGPGENARGASVRVTSTKHPGYLHVALEANRIKEQQAKAIDAIKFIDSENRQKTRDKLVEYLYALMYQQGVMIFATLDGFFHQLAIAHFMNEENDTYKVAFKRSRDKTFNSREIIEKTFKTFDWDGIFGRLKPNAVTLDKYKLDLDTEIRNMFSERSEVVHRAARVYDLTLEAIEKRNLLVTAFIDSVITYLISTAVIETRALNVHPD